MPKKGTKKLGEKIFLWGADVLHLVHIWQPEVSQVKFLLWMIEFSLFLWGLKNFLKKKNITLNLFPTWYNEGDCGEEEEPTLKALWCHFSAFHSHFSLNSACQCHLLAFFIYLAIVIGVCVYEVFLLKFSLFNNSHFHFFHFLALLVHVIPSVLIFHILTILINSRCC